MCNPISIASAVLNIGGQVASFVQASGAADAQNAVYEQNRLNSEAAFRDSQKQTDARIMQEQDAASAERFDSNLAYRKADATQRVAAGEAGISGLSLDGLLRDFAVQQDRYVDRINQNEDWTVGQLGMEKRGQAAQTVDRINSVQKGQRPSFIGTGLRIAATGLDAYSSYRADNPAAPKAAKVPVPTSRPLR